MRGAYSSAGGGDPVYAGDIWLIADELLTFGDDDPATRTRHERRYVLVVQGDDRANNANCPTILVAPLSSNTSAKRPWEDILEESETPLRRPSIVKTHLIQPIPRSALANSSNLIGTVPDPVLKRVLVHILSNLGIIS